MTTKKAQILILLSLFSLTGCLLQTQVESINKTYSIRYTSGVDYNSATVCAHGRKLASYDDNPLYSGEISRQEGWQNFALLEKENTLLFISPDPNSEIPRFRLLVSVNGAKPINITERVIEWAWQHQDYEDKSAPINLGPLKIEDDQLKVGLECPTNGRLKMNQKTSIPLSVIHEFIAQSQSAKVAP